MNLEEVKQWICAAETRCKATRPYSELFVEDEDQSVGELNLSDIDFLSHAHEDMSKALAILKAVLALTKSNSIQPVNVMCPECSYTNKIPEAFAEQPALCPSCRSTVKLKILSISISSETLISAFLK